MAEVKAPYAPPEDDTIVLKQGLWIKPGTVFKGIDGVRREYVSGNYEALVELSKDCTMSIVVGEDILEDRPELFNDGRQVAARPT